METWISQHSWSKQAFKSTVVNRTCHATGHLKLRLQSQKELFYIRIVGEYEDIKFVRHLPFPFQISQGKFYTTHITFLGFILSCFFHLFHYLKNPCIAQLNRIDLVEPHWLGWITSLYLEPAHLIIFVLVDKTNLFRVCRF